MSAPRAPGMCCAPIWRTVTPPWSDRAHRMDRVRSSRQHCSGGDRNDERRTPPTGRIAMPASPLILGAAQKAALDTLQAYARANPIDVLAVRETVQTPAGHAAHIERMQTFTVAIPTAFVVTYSI